MPRFKVTSRRNVPATSSRQESDIIIALIGPTGSGRSNFIDIATNGDGSSVGHGLAPKTLDILIVRYRHPAVAEDFVFVDTPGFGHEYDETDILKMIADWLKRSYDQNKKLSAILYLHDISAERMTGSRRLDRNLFEQLCGKDVLTKVWLVTTYWTVPEVKRELENEAQLRVEVWPRKLWPEARTARFYNSFQSAWTVIGGIGGLEGRGLCRHVDTVGPNSSLDNPPKARVSVEKEHQPTGKTVRGSQPSIDGYPFADPIPERQPQRQEVQRPSVTAQRLTPPVSNRVKESDIIIALMGPIGSGKSNFIDIAARQNGSSVGHELVSKSKEVRAVRFKHPISTDNYCVLVDTPGFDDTYKPDSEILDMIARWLKTTYSKDKKLTGILYLHRISDNRMAGTPLRNLHMFNQLCGKSDLTNVCLLTTMWSVPEAEIELRREEELKNKFWRGMLAAGARMSRFFNTFESAWAVIGNMDGLEKRALLIQEELVDLRRPLGEAFAGKALAEDEQELAAQEETWRRLQNQIGAQPPEPGDLHQKYREIEARRHPSLDDAQKERVSFMRTMRKLFSRKAKS